MRIGRTIPPAASPIYLRDILNGFKGLIRGGREVERFEAELRDYFKVNHVFLVSSGKAALTLILKAIHKFYPHKDEVLIPAFCCYSVPSAIVRAGLKIRLCDVNSDTLDFDYNQLKELIAQSSPVNSAPLVSAKHSTEQAKLKAQSKELNESANQAYQLNQQGNLREVDDIQPTTNNMHADRKLSAMSNELLANRLLAIIPVHLFGLTSDVKHIRELVADSTVKVVEDAAQVMGAEQKGQKLGTFGDVGFFSLGRSKSISAVEGGIILTNNDRIAQQVSMQLEDIYEYSLFEKLKLLLQAFALSFFQSPSFFWIPKSLPFLRVGDTIYDPNFKIRKLSGLQAGLVREWKAKLSEYAKSRRASASRWSSIFDAARIPDYVFRNGHLPNFIRYPIRLQSQKTWKRTLRQSEKHGLGIQLTYPASINGISELCHQFAGRDFPAAGKLAREILTLPVHPLLEKKDIAKIESYIEFLRN